MNLLTSTPVILNILGILSLLGAAMAFASGPVVSAVALDWYPEQKPSRLNRCIGYIFGIKTYADILRVYTGGTYNDIRKRTDNSAPARGVVWTLIGTAFLIAGQLF